MTVEFEGNTIKNCVNRVFAIRTQFCCAISIALCRDASVRCDHYSRTATATSPIGLHDRQTSVNGVLMVNADLRQTVRVKDVRAFDATSQKSRSRQPESC
jgi:hypothetical protein